MQNTTLIRVYRKDRDLLRQNCKAVFLIDNPEELDASKLTDAFLFHRVVKFYLDH
jgi:hypothetical protein